MQLDLQPVNYQTTLAKLKMNHCPGTPRSTTFADDTSRRQSCSFADDACAHNHLYHVRRMSTPLRGDHETTDWGDQIFNIVPASSVLSDQMEFSPIGKTSHSSQCVRRWCSSECVWNSRRSCTLADLECDPVFDPDPDCCRKRRRHSTVPSSTMYFQHKECSAAATATAATALNSAEHVLISDNVEIASDSGFSVQIKRRTKSIDRFYNNGCHSGLMRNRRESSCECCPARQTMDNNLAPKEQFPVNHQLGKFSVFDCPSHPERSISCERSVKHLLIPQEHETGNLGFPETLEASKEFKHTTPIPKSNSYSNKMESRFTVNTERVGKTVDCDTERCPLSARKPDCKTYKVLQHETARNSNGNSSYSPVSEPSPLFVKSEWIRVSPCIQKDRMSKEGLQLQSPSTHQVFIFPERSYRSTHQECVGAREQQQHPQVQHQFERGQQNSWKHPLSSVTELSDDGKDSDPAHAKLAALVQVEQIKAQSPSLRSGSRSPCPCKDPAQAASLQQMEQNVFIFLSPTRLKVNRKNIDTVLISFSVSPACITFSVLQVNSTSERIAGGVIFAKVLILDSRLANCKEACYKSNCFVVNLGHEVHFCFPDPMSLEFMSLNIEMFQQNKKKNKGFGCVEIKLSDQNQLTDVILWKTLHRQEKVGLWGRVCSCITRSGRRQEYLKRLSTEHL